jgi:hypothetical protein
VELISPFFCGGGGWGVCLGFREERKPDLDLGGGWIFEVSSVIRNSNPHT